MAKRWAVAGVGIPAVLGLLYLGGWPLAVPVAALAALAARDERTWDASVQRYRRSDGTFAPD